MSKEPMKIDKADREAMAKAMKEQDQARCQQCLDAITEALTSFDCQLITTEQRIGADVQHGYVIATK